MSSPYPAHRAHNTTGSIISASRDGHGPIANDTQRVTLRAAATGGGAQTATPSSPRRRGRGCYPSPWIPSSS